MTETQPPLNMDWKKRRTKLGERGITFVPKQCHKPEDCLDCYVTKLYKGNPTYCGNPRNLRRFKAWQSGKKLKEAKGMSDKAFVDGGKVFLARGSLLKCHGCGHEWQTKKARKPTTKTGVRCPKCHSRNVAFSDGTPIVKKKSHKVRMTKDSDFGESAEFEKTRSGTGQRGDVLDRLKDRLREDRQPPTSDVEDRQVPRGKGTEGDFVESHGGKGFEELMTADEVGEIFDPETFDMIHGLEVDAMCKKFNKPRLEVYDKHIESLSKKMSLILKLVFRHPDLGLGLKITIGLYIIQQMALIGAIMGTSATIATDEEKEE